MKQFIRSLLLSLLYSAALTFLLNFVARPLFKRLWHAIYLRRHPKAAGWLKIIKDPDPDIQHGRLVADAIAPDKVKRRRTVLFLPLILLVGMTGFWNPFSHVHLQWFSGTTYTAASASYADVSTAYGLCSDGDTLAIPADSKTWSSTLTVTKAITIKGAGKTLTVLSGASTEQYFILQPGSDKAQRVTGIGFIGGGAGSPKSKILIYGVVNGSYVLDKIRIDHCDFENDNEAIWADGWIESLIDHNSFKDCNRTIIIVGDDNYAWTRTIAAGTSHALFIEDNTFVYTNAHVGLDQWIYHQEGGRTVVRHNSFDGTAETGADCACFDSHGNQNYWTGGTDFRGQPIVEIYNNTFAVHHTYQFFIFRGGSVLMHDNALTYITSGSNPIQLGEEEDDPGHISWFNPTRTAWPAQDQINNSFFWNNTLNGSAITDVTLWFPSTDPTFIQKNRDYWMAQPAASGGYEYYTGARQGGSQTAPTGSDTGSMAFSASGANAYYPFTCLDTTSTGPTYTYPNPLNTDSGGGGGGGSFAVILK